MCLVCGCVWVFGLVCITQQHDSPLANPTAGSRSSNDAGVLASLSTREGRGLCGKKPLFVCFRETPFALFEPASTPHAHTTLGGPAKKPCMRCASREASPSGPGTCNKKESSMSLSGMQVSRTREPHPNHSHAPHRSRAGTRAGRKREDGSGRRTWSSSA
jgi:hypothetical protein